MAIQHRRGPFAQFDPTRLLPGEWAIVLSGDTSTSDGSAAYMCFGSGRVKRMATYDDLWHQIEEIEGDITSDLVAIVGAAAQEAHDAAVDAGNYGLRLTTLEEWAFGVAHDWPDGDEMRACCEQVRADLASIAATLAPLAGTWMAVSEALFAPTAAAFSVSGTTGTAAATVSGTTLILA